MRTLVFAAACLLVALTSALGMSYEDRQRLDLRSYVVTDPNAAYFDVAERKAYLQTVTSPLLLNEIERHRAGLSCRDVMAMPVINHEIRLPGFYVDHAGWEELAVHFYTFEDAVSELAAAQMVATDNYHAECLVDLLRHWADQRALEDFYYSTQDRQAWYQVESSLFASSMALSTVRALVPERAADIKVIDDWLLRVARRHSSISGLPATSCCNNHLYRRALYSALIGVTSNDNAMFRFAVGAIYSALSDTTAGGALVYEMQRGKRAVHYQNYAAMYLVFLAHVIEGQGYDIFDLQYEGRTLHDIVNVTLDMIEDPTLVKKIGVNEEQDMGFLSDSQYFTWMELYLTRFESPRMAAILAERRPTRSRSLGGYTTLYFYREEEAE